MQQFVADTFAVLPHIATGYALLFVVLLLLLQINVDGRENVFGASGRPFLVEFSRKQKRMRRLINFAFLGTKMMTVLLIDIVAFPFCCGMVIDVCSLPMFFGLPAATD